MAVSFFILLFVLFWLNIKLVCNPKIQSGSSQYLAKRLTMLKLEYPSIYVSTHHKICQSTDFGAVKLVLPQINEKNRPGSGEFRSFKSRHTTFLNLIKFADLLILKL